MLFGYGFQPWKTNQLFRNIKFDLQPLNFNNEHIGGYKNAMQGTLLT